MDSTMRDGKPVNQNNYIPYYRIRTIENGYPPRYPVKTPESSVPLRISIPPNIVAPKPIRLSKTAHDLIKM
jgi:hypothetical protein